MQIETLRIFCNLTELGSFSRAAEKNMLSQSAVSQQLAQLEREYNCQLINRHRKSFGLTPAGELFYNTCKDIISRYENFQSSLIDLKNSSRKRIALAAIYSIGMHSLQSYIKNFMAANPDIYLDVEYLSASEIYERLMLGRIDLGFVALPRNNPEIQIVPFIDEPLVLVCCPQNPLAQKSNVDIDILPYHRFIAFAGNLPTRNWIDQLLIRYNIALKPAMEFDNIETIKRVVEIDSGISIMPITAVRNELTSGALAAVSFSNEKFIRPTALLIRRNRAMTKHLRAFVEMIDSSKAEKQK
ncbi:MAG: LysR family transcriptional regulator [Anaerohalosphaeraceae bacterium]|nr:LysR family transcriptional regulator [Anaerohalosphaeraceae bacterium]